MHLIINDILDFSKIESGKLTLEKIKFNLPETINSLINIVSAQAHEKNITFTYAPCNSLTQNVIGDPTRLTQILMNIIGNAMKFTKEGEVSLTAKSTLSNESDKILFDFIIKDSGIGISQEQMENLYNPFTQADSSTTRLFGGTGLGLSIVKELVDLYQGNIKCESQENIGTTFTITIPLGLCSNDEVSQIEKNKKDYVFQKLSILVVEDNKINQTIIKKMIEKLGHDVNVANNGEEAVSLVKESKYDLVLMDWMMPVLDGLEATKRIRSFGGEYKKLPIIGVTANVYSEDRVQCMEAGMNGVLTKPISKISLKECLENLETN